MSSSAFGLAEQALEHPSAEHISETHRIAVEADSAWNAIRGERLEVAERLADALVFRGELDSDAAERYRELHEAQRAARVRRTLATDELHRVLTALESMARRG
jgi:hypothetical protein